MEHDRFLISKGYKQNIRKWCKRNIQKITIKQQNSDLLQEVRNTLVEISLVIPTKNRSEKLKKLLHSVLKQTVLPKEVIIVDDSDNLRTKELIQQLKKLFLKKNIQIKYIMPSENKKKSISRARNIGAKKAKGDIIVFIDDDVVIDKNYLKEILKVFEKNPNALGVQGTIMNMEYSPFWNSIKKVFYYWHAERDKCLSLIHI